MEFTEMETERKIRLPLGTTAAGARRSRQHQSRAMSHMLAAIDRDLGAVYVSRPVGAQKIDQ